jgi:hypothetical protein
VVRHLDTVRRQQLGYDLLSATEPENSWYPTVISLPDSVRRFSWHARFRWSREVMIA